MNRRKTPRSALHIQFFERTQGKSVTASSKWVVSIIFQNIIISTVWNSIYLAISTVFNVYINIWSHFNEPYLWSAIHVRSLQFNRITGIISLNGNKYYQKYYIILPAITAIILIWSMFLIAFHSKLSHISAKNGFCIRHN